MIRVPSARRSPTHPQNHITLGIKLGARFPAAPTA